MHRQRLLSLIDDYAQRRPQEAGVVERFVGFINEHERCFERDCWAGHITGSCWLINEAGSHVLLTHHRKLGKWLQLGGHSDGDPDTLAVARREAQEESGLDIVTTGSGIFDLDVHEIPARKSDPAHYHYDVRFALQADSDRFTVSAESLELAWVPVDDLSTYSGEESLLRMQRKWAEARRD